MMSKFLEKMIKIVPQEISDETGNGLELEYYLVEYEAEGEDCSLQQKGYGIEIIERENGCLKESIMFKDIYCQREKTEKLIKKLIENTVTPVSLPYILDDLVGV